MNADDATGYLLAAVAARKPRRPQYWPKDPPDRFDNTPAGDHRAWLDWICDMRDEDRAAVLGMTRVRRRFDA